MVNRNREVEGKRMIDSRVYRASLLSLCNKNKKEKSSNMSQDSGNNCEPRLKKRKWVDFSSQVTGGVDNAASELLRQVDETHKKRMVELTRKQNVEVLEYFRTKNERKELLDRMYQLEKGVICEQWGELSSNVEKMKKLDEDFKEKWEGLRREMGKCWKDIQAGHVIERTNEEEMKLKKIEVLQSAINALEDGEIFEGLFDEVENFEVTDSDVMEADAPSTLIDSGNPNALLLESELAINTLENFESYTPPTVISRPLLAVQDSSHKKRLSMANERAEISPDDSPRLDMISMPVDPVEQMDEFTAPVILGHGEQMAKGTFLHADSDVATADAPSTSIDSGNPNASLLESESAFNTLENGERYAPPTLISCPALPIQDSSHGKRLNMANEHSEISPDDSPKVDLIAMPVDPDEQMDKFTAPVILGHVEIPPDDSPKESLIAVPVDPDEQIDKSTAPVMLGEPVYSRSSSDTEMALEDAENQGSEGALPSSVMITDSHSPNASGQATFDGFVIISSEAKQNFLKPVPVPVDETAFRISSSVKQLDVLSIPVNPDNLNASDCSPPLLKSLIGPRGHINSMQSLEVLVVPSVTILGNSSKENTIIFLDSDDEQMMSEISAALPVNELEDTDNLLEEAPAISSEQPNQCSAGGSGNELEAFLSTEKNQQHEVQRMLGGVPCPRCSSLCEPLTSGAQISMDQVSAVGELSQHAQGNATSEMHTLFSMAQSCQFPLEQLLPIQLSSSGIRITDESLPSSSCQYVTDNHPMMHPMTRAAEINTQTQLYDTSSNLSLNHPSNSYVTRTNSCQRSSFDPLQIELAKINKADYEAKKNYEDSVVQLDIARDKEIARVWQKYGLLYQQAENDARQKRKELAFCYEKTRAHMLLAKAWALEIDVNSSISLPSTQLQSTGMQTRNAFAGLVGQFSGAPSTNHIPRPQHPLSCQNLLNPEAGHGSYVPNPYINPSFPISSIPLHSNQHPLNLSSSGLSAGYYAHLYS